MEIIRLGTIGSGAIVHSILDAASRTDGICLEAVYSRTRDRAQSLADQYGCGKIYTDMASFLADPRINTVYVATPNLLHYEQTKWALLAGKNVICEKPFTTKRIHAEELAVIAEERGLFLVEAAPTSFLPNFPLLKDACKKIGPIRLVMSNYSQYSSRYDAVLRGERPAIFDPAFGGGALMDINYYNLLLNTLLFGSPRFAKYYPNLRPGLADTSGTVVMRYDGFVSTNCGAKDSRGVNFFQIEGEQGFITVEGGANGLKSLRVVTRGEERTLNEQPDPDRWYYEVREITRLMLLEDRAALEVHLQNTLTTVRILEDLRKEAGILFPGDEE